MPSIDKNAALAACGMDHSAALARFSGNENLLQTFLKEFPEEGYLRAVRRTRESGDAAAYQAAVHTVKGTAGSLGLTKLYAASAAMMEALRAGDDAKAEALLPQVEEEYEKACQAIRQAFSA